MIGDVLRAPYFEFTGARRANTSPSHFKNLGRYFSAKRFRNRGTIHVSIPGFPFGEQSPRPRWAHRIAAHESPRTTQLYDRPSDDIALDEVERIVI
jgi:hypothetical protein